MSLITVSSAPAESRITLAMRRWSVSSRVSSSISAIDITPFIGVRISWLMVARKSDFARVAASAMSRAPISSVSARLRAPTSTLSLTA